MSAGKQKVNVCFACVEIAFTSEHHVQNDTVNKTGYKTMRLMLLDK